MNGIIITIIGGAGVIGWVNYLIEQANAQMWRERYQKLKMERHPSMRVSDSQFYKGWNK